MCCGRECPDPGIWCALLECERLRRLCLMDVSSLFVKVAPVPGRPRVLMTVDVLRVMTSRIALTGVMRRTASLLNAPMNSSTVVMVSQAAIAR